MGHCVKLKDANLLNETMKEAIQEMELPSYEQRFPFKNEPIECYFYGSKDECKKFIASIENARLQEQFEIVKKL